MKLKISLRMYTDDWMTYGKSAGRLAKLIDFPKEAIDKIDPEVHERTEKFFSEMLNELLINIVKSKQNEIVNEDIIKLGVKEDEEDQTKKENDETISEECREINTKTPEEKEII